MRNYRSSAAYQKEVMRNYKRFALVWLPEYMDVISMHIPNIMVSVLGYNFPPF